MTDSKDALSTNSKRRGIVCTSITHLDDCVLKLEGKDETLRHKETIQWLLQKLDKLDTDFKSYRFARIDLVEDAALDTEQGVLDEHDDKVASLAARVQQLILQSSIISSSSVT